MASKCNTRLTSTKLTSVVSVRGKGGAIGIEQSIPSNPSLQTQRSVSSQAPFMQFRALHDFESVVEINTSGWPVLVSIVFLP